MDTGNTTGGKAGNTTAVLDAALRIGLIALLVYACSRIMLPFIGVLIWSGIIAVMLYPLHIRLAARVGNRWSAVIMGAVGVAFLLVPLVIAATSIGSSILTLVSGLRNHTLVISPPPPRLAELPLVGRKLSDAWSLVATNTPAAIAQYGDMLKKPVAWAASFAGGLAAGVLAFALSFGIAAVLVAYARSCADFAQALFTRVTGSAARATRLVSLTAATIRGVAQGIVGVAIIQSLILGVGFFTIGIPGAGVLTLLALILGIVQVPAILLVLPAIGYVFSIHDTTPAIVFAIYMLIGGLADNVLKPLMLGRGLEVPMPVIFLGVIGGMVVDGLLGLFVGPVVLAVGYMLFIEWVRQPTGETPPA